VAVGLTHGQEGIASYLINKVSWRSRIEAPATTESRLLRSFGRGVSVIVYGHSHVSRVNRRDGTLILNPGSLAPPYFTDRGATMAILDLSGETPEAEVISVV
jgi:predicted phosphodiesterase